jgi:hypothetical protein
MTRYININGIRREMTQEEEAKFELDIQANNEYKLIKEQEEIELENKKLSVDLGLTEEEVKAIIGI